MKYDKLQARWSKREQDIMFIYPRKRDGAFLGGAFAFCKLLDGKTLLEELEARGYDLTTLRFSIALKKATSEGETK